MKPSMPWAGGALAALLFTSTLAHAQPTPQQRREAQTLVAKGRQLMKQGSFKEAEATLQKARALDPQPSTQLELARTLIELKKLVKAGEVLREAAATKPTQWQERQAMTLIEALTEELAERTPTLAVEVAEPKSSAVTVTVDGGDFDPSDGPVRFDPGRHVLVARAPGYTEHTQTLELREGDHDTVRLRLDKAEAEPEEESSGGGMGKVPAFVAWGTGAVGLGLGIGFGIAAINAKDTAFEQYDCKNDRCPQDAEEALDVSKLNGNVSTVGFVIGGVGVASGIVLWFLSGGGDDAADESEPEGAFRVTAQPMVGLGYAGLTGTF